MAKVEVSTGPSSTTNLWQMPRPPTSKDKQLEVGLCILSLILVHIAISHYLASRSMAMPLPVMAVPLLRRLSMGGGLEISIQTRVEEVEGGWRSWLW